MALRRSWDGPRGRLRGREEVRAFVAAKDREAKIRDDEP
jgi:hypothetical protein